MFVLNPDKYLLPDYKISPFQTKDLAFNISLPQSSMIDSYFKERFNGRDFTYTTNGRSALNKALAYYGLQPQDIVTILTTSGNHYVSCCVTGEVEKFCKWNRETVASTKVIIVVHEFGYPFTGWDEIKKLDIPVIEDCAYSFFSADETNSINHTGEFAVYSFPKMFPLQIGGLLTSAKGKIEDEKSINLEVETYIKSVLSHYISKKEEIIQQRKENYEWYKQVFQSMGFQERFVLNDGIVPGAFMFRVPEGNINLPKMKEYLFTHGIQCSVFYGEDAFFIPVHQALNETDRKYIAAVIQSYLHEN